MYQFERIKDMPDSERRRMSSPDGGGGVFNQFVNQEDDPTGSLKSLSLNSPNLCLGQPRSHGLCTMRLRTLVRALASVDVIYALLLLGLHLLVLITGGSKSKTLNNAVGGGSKQDTSFTSGSSTEDPNFPNPTSSGAELSYSSITQKTQERIAVLIWIGMFAICILQILVAGALYGGTNERDGRICIRNCRIWSYTSSFLIAIIVFQLCGIFIMPGKDTVRKHVVAIVVYFVELICRLIGLIVIHRFIKEVKYELCDLDMDEHVVYYELQPAMSTPPKVNSHTRNGHLNIQSHSA